MASRRMIWADISVSTQANQLSDFAKVCFTWAFPHLDDHGRIKADPMVFKAVVVPMSDHSVKDVSDALYHMEEFGLIERWEVDGVKVAFFPGFYKRQPGLNKHTKSKLPDKPGSVTPEHTKTHPEGKGTEGKGTEGKDPPTTIEEFGEKQTKAWREAFPSVDLPLEWSKARAWLVANPHRPKKRLAAFFYNWLSRALATPKQPSPNGALDRLRAQARNG